MDPSAEEEVGTRLPVQAVPDALEQLARLRAATQALARAEREADVLRVVVTRCAEAMGAWRAVVGLRRGDEVELAESLGYPAETMREFSRFPLAADLPLSACVRDAVPLYFARFADYARRFPRVATHAQAISASHATLPLVGRAGVLGAIQISFREAQEFRAEDRLFLEAVADVAAQALERARSLDEVAGMEARWRGLVAQVPVMVIETDDSLAIRYVNRAAPGYEAWALLGRNALEFVAPEDRPLAEARLRAALREGRPVRYDVRGVLPEGAGRWYDTSAAPVFRDGRVVGVVLSTQDVHEARVAADDRERLLAALELERGLLRAVIDQMPSGVVVRSADGRLLVANEQAHRILRWPDDQADLVASSWAAEVRTPAGERVAPEGFPMARALRGERVEREKLVARWPDGTVASVELSAAPVRGPEGAIAAAVAILVDVTTHEQVEAQLAAARQQLAQSEKMTALGTLVSGVAHEIRTPLTYLASHVHLLERRTRRLALPDADRAALEEHAAAALESVERLNALVGSLGRFVRSSAPGPRRGRLDEAVRDAVRLFEAASRGRIRVEADLAPTPWSSFDPIRLQQVALNLLQNAAEAEPRDGVVRVATGATAQGEAFLAVEDRGCGLAPAVRARMFEPFFTTKPEGTGLGLAIVRRILEEHGGRIEVESEPGQGSRFRVLLPAN